jgi:uncharacterized damage-inducible protein DinB
VIEPNGREIAARLEREWLSLVQSISVSGRSPLDLPPDRRMALSRVALLAQLEEVREEWNAIASRIDQDTAARFVNASWTLKDLLAHMASWAREFRSEVERAAGGESFDYAIPFAFTVLGPSQWNEREVAARKEKSLPEIIREFGAETERLEELVATMDEDGLYRPTRFPLAPSGNPDERMALPPAMVVSGKCVHDRHHFAQIRRLLDRLVP